jgi:hypothetical protein
MQIARPQSRAQWISRECDADHSGRASLGLRFLQQSNRPKVEDVMRLAVIALVAFAVLVAHTAPGFACPDGYVPCGTKSCCPKR